MKTTSITLCFLFCFLSACNPEGRCGPPATPEDDKHTPTVDVGWPHDRTEIVVPLRFVRSLPVIECRLNGPPARFLVDTGASHICLYQDRLEKYGIDSVGEKDISSVTGAGKTKKSVWSGAFTMMIQDALSVKVSSAKCLPAAANGKMNVDGILSVSLMKALNCVIDLKDATITFSASTALNKWQPGRTALVAPLEYAGTLPVIQCKLNGKPARFLVDTGSDQNGTVVCGTRTYVNW